ncbi:MAG: START domain-containing protein, partial [Desulfosalsimonas sp.]
ASMDRVGEVLRDIDSYPDWMAKVKEAKTLEKYSPNDMDVYLVLNFPWPASDRYVVATAETQADLDAAGSITTTRVIEDEQIEDEKGMVRLPQMHQQYVLSFKERGKTEVTFTLYLESGGNLSSLTVNPVIKGVPHASLENLKSYVEKDKYQNTDPFDEKNIDITRVIVESILRRNFDDENIIAMVLDDRELMNIALDEGYSDDGCVKTASAIIRKYVGTQLFRKDIEDSEDRDLLAELKEDTDLAGKISEDEKILDQFIQDGEITNRTLGKMAHLIRDTTN